jgi:hypothetical protein
VRCVLVGFSRSLSRPLAVALVAAAQLAAMLGLTLSTRVAAAAGLPAAVAATVLVIAAARGWRAIALATALPRITGRAWPDTAVLITRAARLLALDALELTLASALVVAGVWIGAMTWRTPWVLALGLAPILWLGAFSFATFRAATLEVGTRGAPVPTALGAALSHVVARAPALVNLPLWLGLAALPLLLAAAASGATVPWAAAGGALSCWGYAALDAALTRGDETSSSPSWAGADRTGC